MATDVNKRRAIELYSSLQGDYTLDGWVPVIVKVLAFLLNRYVNED